MRKSNLFKLLALFVIASMALAACGDGGAAEPATGSDGPKTTSTGFVCP